MSTPREDLDAALAGRAPAVTLHEKHWVVRSRIASDMRGLDKVEEEARDAHRWFLKLQPHFKPEDR